jgi:hypothetical protein
VTLIGTTEVVPFQGMALPRGYHSMTEMDEYVTDVLMRDLVGHDKRPVSFLVYLWLAAEGQRLDGWCGGGCLRRRRQLRRRCLATRW